VWVCGAPSSSSRFGKTTLPLCPSLPYPFRIYYVFARFFYFWEFPFSLNPFSPRGLSNLINWTWNKPFGPPTNILVYPFLRRPNFGLPSNPVMDPLLQLGFHCLSRLLLFYVLTHRCFFLPPPPLLFFSRLSGGFRLRSCPSKKFCCPPPTYRNLKHRVDLKSGVWIHVGCTHIQSRPRHLFTNFIRGAFP